MSDVEIIGFEPLLLGMAFIKEISNSSSHLLFYCYCNFFHGILDLSLRLPTMFPCSVHPVTILVTEWTVTGWTDF